MRERPLLRQYENVGTLFNLAQKELYKLGVSDGGIEHLVSAAKAGAVGAKLTGGGHGGCVIALAERKNMRTISGNI